MGPSFRDILVNSLETWVLSLYHFMGTSRITCIVEKTNRGILLGDIILLNIEDLILDSSLHGSTWDMDVKFISKYVDKHCWLYYSVEYNATYKIQINVEYGTLHGYRENDTSIMCKASELYSKMAELKSVSRVRMLHKLVNLSDVTTADGRKLDKNYLTSNGDTQRSVNINGKEK